MFIQGYRGSINDKIPYFRLPYGKSPNETGFSNLVRSSRQRSGPSPAMGVYAEPEMFYHLTGKHITTNESELKLDSKGSIIRFSRVWDDFYVYAYRTVNDSLAIGRYIDVSGATECVRRGTGRYNDPIRYYANEYRQGYENSTYNTGLTPKSFEVLDWTPDDWRRYIASRSSIYGTVYNEETGSYRVNGVYYMLSGLLNEVPSSANPAPKLLGEHFGEGGNVYFDSGSSLFGVRGGNALLMQAKLNALENIPVDRLNWIQTTLECFTALYSGMAVAAEGLAKRHISDRAYRVVRDTSKDLASSGWLSYRYVYNTTKMDISEVSNVSRRMTKLLLKGRNFHSYGVATIDDVIARTSLEFSTAQLLDLNNPLTKLSRMWAYDAWDLIPFSFMVDWFLDVGDYLLARADQDMLIQCPPIEAWGSITYNATPKDSSEYTNTQRYMRFRLSDVDLQHYPEYFAYESAQKSASSTTIIKRVADAAAIAVGIL